jgi:hypothetical protein
MALQPSENCVQKLRTLPSLTSKLELCPIWLVTTGYYTPSIPTQQHRIYFEKKVYIALRKHATTGILQN